MDHAEKRIRIADSTSSLYLHVWSNVLFHEAYVLNRCAHLEKPVEVFTKVGPIFRAIFAEGNLLVVICKQTALEDGFRGTPTSLQMLTMALISSSMYAQLPALPA